MTKVAAENNANLTEHPHEHATTITKNHILVTFFSCIGGFLFGYNTAVISGAMLTIEPQFSLSHSWEELIVGMIVFGAAVFSFMAAPLNDAIGRRPVLLTSSIISVIGSLISCVSLSKESLVVGRLIMGLAIGLSSATVPIYVSECAPAEKRGKMTIFFQFSVTLGMLFSAIFSAAFQGIGQKSWRILFGIAIVPAVVMFVGMVFMPESPRWLLMRRKHNLAERSYEWLNQSKTPQTHEDFELIHRDITTTRYETTTTVEDTSTVVKTSSTEKKTKTTDASSAGKESKKQISSGEKSGTTKSTNEGNESNVYHNINQNNPEDPKKDDDEEEDDDDDEEDDEDDDEAPTSTKPSSSELGVKFSSERKKASSVKPKESSAKKSKVSSEKKDKTSEGKKKEKKKKFRRRIITRTDSEIRAMPIVRFMITAPGRRALFLGCFLQMMQQLSGVNVIIYYAATIIRLTGVQSTAVVLWLTVVLMLVNCLACVVSFFLVGRFGRRVLTIYPLIGVFIALMLVAVAFALMVQDSSVVSEIYSLPKKYHGESCNDVKTCDMCSYNQFCGYCYKDPPQGSTKMAVNGSCLPTRITHAEFSLYGPCRKGGKKGSKFAYGFCPTKIGYSVLAMLGLILFFLCYEASIGPMAMIICAEIFPQWGRSTGMAITIAINWIFNFMITFTFLSVSSAIARHGIFFLYAVFCIIGAGLLAVILPETKGQSLEEIELLFEKRWNFGLVKI